MNSAINAATDAAPTASCDRRQADKKPKVVLAASPVWPMVDTGLAAQAVLCRRTLQDVIPRRCRGVRSAAGLRSRERGTAPVAAYAPSCCSVQTGERYLEVARLPQGKGGAPPVLGTWTVLSPIVHALHAEAVEHAPQEECLSPRAGLESAARQTLPPITPPEVSCDGDLAHTPCPRNPHT